MVKALAKLAGGVVLVATGLAAALLVGMRMKSPLVLDALRRFNRDITNRRAMETAGTPGAYASVIRHVGRTSGLPYETPVRATATDDGFLIALPYGTRADWLKNVRASGSATIVDEGMAHEVDHPEIVPMTEVSSRFPPLDRRTISRFGVDQCLHVRRVSVHQDSAL
jgi:deazaflavin-dependent oxidoreductase (nitroreductase family)